MIHIPATQRRACARHAELSNVGSGHRLPLTRKNALFAGHDDGAQNWAILASLIETCKLGGIDPQNYIADVLTRLVNLWPMNRLDELLPWTWVASHHQLPRAA